jgi:leader peptidase (prepilin peptidase) / N-methyltransferase
MSLVFWILVSGILAGWLVNVLADTIPLRRSLWETWRWPLQHLRILPADPTPTLVATPTAADEGPSMPTTSRYLLVWLAAIALGWVAYTRLGWTPKALLVALEAWFFLTIAVIDLEHRLVLNRMVVVAAPCLLIANLLLGEVTITSILLGAAAGFGFFLVLALLAPGGMGMGDVKLAGLIGLTTGLSTILVALFIAILAGGVAAAIIMINGRRRHHAWRGQTMAYAPYLVVGVWVVLFDGIELLYNYLERL